MLTHASPRTSSSARGSSGSERVNFALRFRRHRLPDRLLKPDIGDMVGIVSSSMRCAAWRNARQSVGSRLVLRSRASGPVDTSGCCIRDITSLERSGQDGPLVEQPIEIVGDHCIARPMLAPSTNLADTALSVAEAAIRRIVRFPRLTACPTWQTGPATFAERPMQALRVRERCESVGAGGDRCWTIARSTMRSPSSSAWIRAPSRRAARRRPRSANACLIQAAGRP